MGTALKRSMIPSNAENPAIEKKVYNFYTTLLHQWDPQQLNNSKRLKALFFDKSSRPIGLWDIPSVDQIKPEEVFLAAQKANANSIVIAQNDPLDETLWDDEVKKLIDLFKKASKGFSIKLEDVIKFSKWSYFSSLENNRI